eukprot:2607901-Pyramimonas_sp.AAC.2
MCSLPPLRLAPTLRICSLPPCDWTRVVSYGGGGALAAGGEAAKRLARAVARGGLGGRGARHRLAALAHPRAARQGALNILTSALNILTSALNIPTSALDILAQHVK